MSGFIDSLESRNEKDTRVRATLRRSLYFAPGAFVPAYPYVEHFVKDLGIALAEAERMKLALPGLALAHQLYVALAAQGHARDGTQALLLALASLSAVDWPGAAPAGA